MEASDDHYLEVLMFFSLNHSIFYLQYFMETVKSLKQEGINNNAALNEEITL